MTRDSINIKPLTFNTSFGDSLIGMPLTQSFSSCDGLIGMSLNQSFSTNSCFTNPVNFSSSFTSPSVFSTPALSLPACNLGFSNVSMPSLNFGNFAMPSMNFNFGNFSFGGSFGSSLKSTSNFSKIDTSGTPGMDINQISAKWRSEHNVKYMTLPNGIKILGSKTTKFLNTQPEWQDMQKYMLQAAKNVGVTLVYGDMERTKAESDAGRRKKGNIVCAGGESPHNYGVAADICLFKDGKSVPVGSDLHNKFAAEVKRLSGGKIGWGGDFGNGRGKYERHHFEIANWRNKYHQKVAGQKYLVLSHNANNGRA